MFALVGQEVFDSINARCNPEVHLTLFCRNVALPHSRLRTLHELNRGITCTSSVKLANVRLTTGMVPKSDIIIKKKIV